MDCAERSMNTFSYLIGQATPIEKTSEKKEEEASERMVLGGRSQGKGATFRVHAFLSSGRTGGRSWGIMFYFVGKRGRTDGKTRLSLRMGKKEKETLTTSGMAYLEGG